MALPEGEKGADQDENVVFLRGASGQVEAVEATKEAREEARRQQARRKAEFLYLKAGAQARASQLPRALTAALAHGTANLMLVHLINGVVTPKTAKEAAEVAKVAHDIARSASGRGPTDGPLSDAEREALIQEAQQMEQVLRDRAKQLGEKLPLAGAVNGDEHVPDVDDEPDEWDFGDTPPTGGSVPDQGA